jgi:DNA processing protein
MTERALTDQERLEWHRLSQSENVGPVTFQKLLTRYGTAAKALEALPTLSRQGGLARPLRIYSTEAAAQDFARAEKCGGRFVAAGEAGYPPYLRYIHAAPPLLCVAGHADFAQMDAVAIVGARNASAVGMKFARQLANELAGAGFIIVSGLARGIDTAAHQAALSRATLAVVAGGIDYVYPPENADLYTRIASQGLLVSEMPPGAVPKAEHFPRRNRIISGISRATIVVEAAMRSGSLITARLANEQGRDVFAVPGSPLDPRCEGTNKLIREGATMLTSAQDVISALAISPAGFQNRQMFLEDAEPLPPIDQHLAAADRNQVLGLLSPTPIDIDDFIRECAMDPATVMAILLELELAGKLVRQAGGAIGRA